MRHQSISVLGAIFISLLVAYPAQAMQIRPLHDRVIVERIVNETTSADEQDAQAQKQSRIGEVVAVGQGKVLCTGGFRQLDVKVGDRVLFGKNAGTSVGEFGEQYIILREDDILGIIDP